MVRPRQEFLNVSYLSIYLAIYQTIYLSKTPYRELGMLRPQQEIYLSKTLYRELGMVRPRQEFLNVSIYRSMYVSIQLAS